MDTSSKALSDTVKLGAGRDLALGTINLDVFYKRNRNLKLVRVRVGALSFLELLDVSRTQFEVLL